MSTLKLPGVSDPNFRRALREARVAAGLSFSELARRAGIHPVMPARYEDAAHSNATLPSLKTWEKLNEALFPVEGRQPDTTRQGNTDGLSLRSAGVDEIVAELKRRGAISVTINW